MEVIIKKKKFKFLPRIHVKIEEMQEDLKKNVGLWVGNEEKEGKIEDLREESGFVLF